jgi:hypothetical protein
MYSLEINLSISHFLFKYDKICPKKSVASKIGRINIFNFQNHFCNIVEFSVTKNSHHSISPTPQIKKLL